MKSYQTYSAIAGLLVIVAAVCNGAASSALASGCRSCDGGELHGQSLAAPACCGPMFGTTPGCCECPPSACDNAWDGFCQEKLCWKRLWYNIGTGVHVHGRRAHLGRGDRVVEYRYVPSKQVETLPGVARPRTMPTSEATPEPPAPRPEPESRTSSEPDLQPVDPAEPTRLPAVEPRPQNPPQISPQLRPVSQPRSPANTQPAPRNRPATNGVPGSPHYEDWDLPFPQSW